MPPSPIRWFVVEIRNTGGAPLELWQNGDWSLPWDQWRQGGAL